MFSNIKLYIYSFIAFLFAMLGGYAKIKQEQAKSSGIKLEKAEKELVSSKKNREVAKKTLIEERKQVENITMSEVKKEDDIKKNITDLELSEIQDVEVKL